MRVGQRLYLAVLPAAVGVLLIVALSYWGERGRQAPQTVVLVGALAVAGSLVIAWRNTRYVAERIERLARTRRAPGDEADGDAGDELTTIEGTVTELRDAVSATQVTSRRRVREAEERVAEHVTLLEALAGPVADQLREAQLPLHILLESRFGELNENQEEMIEAARKALEAADVAVRRVRRVVDLERATAPPTSESVRPVDLVRPVLAVAAARAERRRVRLTVEVPPDLPLVIVEPYQTEEALITVLSGAVDQVGAGGAAAVRAVACGRVVELHVEPGVPATLPDVILARRLLAASGAELSFGPFAVTVRLRVGPRPGGVESVTAGGTAGGTAAAPSTG